VPVVPEPEPGVVGLVVGCCGNVGPVPVPVVPVPVPVVPIPEPVPLPMPLPVPVVPTPGDAGVHGFTPFR